MTPHELWLVAQTLTAAVAAIESYEAREEFLTRLRLRTLLAEMDEAIDSSSMPSGNSQERRLHEP